MPGLILQCRRRALVAPPWPALAPIAHALTHAARLAEGEIPVADGMVAVGVSGYHKVAHCDVCVYRSICTICSICRDRGCRVDVAG